MKTGGDKPGCTGFFVRVYCARNSPNDIFEKKSRSKSYTNVCSVIIELQNKKTGDFSFDEHDFGSDFCNTFRAVIMLSEDKKTGAMPRTMQAEQISETELTRKHWFLSIPTKNGI